MNDFGSVVTVIHIVFASLFVVTMAVVQIAVGPAMSKIPMGEDKQKAAGVIQGRVKPTMDFAIIVLNATVLYFLFNRMEMIAGSVWLMVKISFGFTALTIANLLHFYWRGKKGRLKTAGKTDKLKALNRFTLFMEKVVLTLAGVTFFMGVMFNHL